MTTLAPDDHRHGTTNGYSNYRCKCAACRTAWAAYCRERKVKVRQRELQDPDCPRHGQLRTYVTDESRCSKCQEAYDSRLNDIEVLILQRGHECRDYASDKMSKAQREGFICNDCLDKFQAWLRSIL